MQNNSEQSQDEKVSTALKKARRLGISESYVLIGGDKVKELENFVISKRDAKPFTSNRTNILKKLSFGNGLTTQENLIVKKMANKLATDMITKTAIQDYKTLYTEASQEIKKNSIKAKFLNFMKSRSNSFSRSQSTTSTSRSSSRNTSKDSGISR